MTTSRTLQALFGTVLSSGLVRTGIGAAATRAVGLVLALSMSVFLARVMGAERLGHYSLALAAVSLLGIPIQMGLPSLVLRETARSFAVGDWPLMRGIWFWSTRRVLLFSAIMSAAAIAAVVLVPTLIQPEARPVFLVGLALLPLIALSQVRSAALRGLGRVVPSQLPDAILRPALFMLLTGAAYLATGPQLTAVLVMNMHILAAGLAFLVGVVLLIRSRPEGLVSAQTRQMDSESWRRAILPLALIAGAQSITANADLLMLGWWREAAEIGQYKVAGSAANMCAIGLSIVALVVNPRFATHYRANEISVLSALAGRAAAVGFVASFPIATALLIWPDIVLRLVFGADFAGGATALRLLVLGQIANTFFGSSIGLLTMTGNERHAMKGLVIGATLNVLLNALLVPQYGIEGAAVATLISTLLWNLLLWRSGLNILSVDSSVVGLMRKGPK